MHFSRNLYSKPIAAAILGVLALTPAPAVLAASAATDLGPLSASTRGENISVTVALKLSDLAGAEAMMQRMVTPGDANYLKFLSPEQVERQFGPDESDVARVTATFESYGLSVERASSTTLSVSGKPSALERAFQTNLHQMSMPASATSRAYTFRSADRVPVVPAAIASVVRGVIGLDNRPLLHPHLVKTPAAQHGGPVLAPKHGSSGTPADEPGEFTVKDFATLYDVNPLYARGISGNGRTIGILTFASFTPSDATAYWKYAAVKVKSNRLTIVNVDCAPHDHSANCGPGDPSDASGSDETTADVEQSGGVAPNANIIVYQAPNSSQGQVDVFARMVHDNRADSFSISWGVWELFDNLATSPVNDAFTGQVVSELRATHELLVIAALQGQTGFASSGDTGAYDAFGLEGGNFNPLSVDYPATDTAITAAGGTTIAFTATFTSPAVTITVAHERVWGWDYLEPLCPAGQSVQDCFVYPAGDGGGVSLFFAMPSYQFGISGTQSSQPHQTYDNPYSTPVVTFGVLPAFFPGRNIPDVSFNADPFTGYILAFTSDGTSTDEGIPDGFSFISGFGGTSFVGPQLNGVMALLGQNVGHRLGLLNPSLYNLAREGFTFGPSPVIRTISSGNNWFYNGRNGYSPAAGLGTIDVYNLSRVTH